jgi:hypothetical protein
MHLICPLGIQSHALLACSFYALLAFMPYWHSRPIGVHALLALMPYWHPAAFPQINLLKCVSTFPGMLLASYVAPRLSMKGAYLHQPVPSSAAFPLLLAAFPLLSAAFPLCLAVLRFVSSALPRRFRTCTSSTAVFCTLVSSWHPQCPLGTVSVLLAPS